MNYRTRRMLDDTLEGIKMVGFGVLIANMSCLVLGLLFLEVWGISILWNWFVGSSQ
jgi:hypothetical protein